MADTIPPLLALLQLTVDNPKLFDLSGGADPEEFKAELREAWTAWYASAAWFWDDMNNPGCSDEPPELSGAALCKRFDVFASCWLESFKDAVWWVAETGNLPEKDDRDFLYFMLGVLRMSRWEHLRERRGRGAPVANFRSAAR